VHDRVGAGDRSADERAVGGGADERLLCTGEVGRRPRVEEPPP
jgi:hypothetical protein